MGFARVAYAAVDLHGFTDYAIHHFTGVQFCFRGRRTHFRRMRVFQPGGVVHQSARGFDFRFHVGEHPLDSLKLSDILAEGAALLGIFHGFFERTLRQPHGQRADANASAIQRAESNL